MLSPFTDLIGLFCPTETHYTGTVCIFQSLYGGRRPLLPAALLHIHQYDVRPHLLDIPIGNRVIRITLKPVEERTAACHDDLAYLSGALVKLKICHFPQSFTVFDIDHFF